MLCTTQRKVLQAKLITRNTLTPPRRCLIAHSKSDQRTPALRHPAAGQAALPNHRAHCHQVGGQRSGPAASGLARRRHSGMAGFPVLGGGSGSGSRAGPRTGRGLRAVRAVGSSRWPAAPSRDRWGWADSIRSSGFVHASVSVPRTRQACGGQAPARR